MARKIAPTLSWHFDQRVFASDPAALRDAAPRMRAELRALLAVAAAARAVQRIDGEGSNMEVPTDYWGALQKQREALARLDRLSRRKP